MSMGSILRGIAAPALFAWTALAGAGQTAYSQAAFDQAVAAGKPVIVHFAASWCPTCKAQQPIVDALLKEPSRKDATFFKADYDTEVALKKQLHVSQQSTFVVFKEGKEVGRSTGQTDRAAIASLFDKAL
jgi:thiol-disulfide isomerase/thioredoxin